MLDIDPQDLQCAKDRIQLIRDRAYDYFLKKNKKTDRVQQRRNNEITDKQAISHIQKIFRYKQKNKNTSSEVGNEINEKKKPKLLGTYYLEQS